MIEVSRRAVVGGLIFGVAAPAIVRVSSIMPVRVVDDMDLLVGFEKICAEIMRELPRWIMEEELKRRGAFLWTADKV